MPLAFFHSLPEREKGKEREKEERKIVEKSQKNEMRSGERKKKGAGKEGVKENNTKDLKFS